MVRRLGDYQKVLKSTDPELKWTRAQEYFADDRCMQALPLLQELIGLFRGTQRMEDVYYMYAEANLCIEDWYMARYTMRNFAKTFPTSDRSEEAEYQAALCSYRLSPEANLDQSDTRTAMDDLQAPGPPPQSDRRDTCNDDRSPGQAGDQGVEGAKLYYTTGKYQSASRPTTSWTTGPPAGTRRRPSSSSSNRTFMPNGAEAPGRAVCRCH